MGLFETTERLKELRGLDPVGEALATAVSRLIPHGPVKDAASGTWLGHALHPVLTDLPIGTWTSATLLDLVGGDDTADAAELLIGLGLLAAVPTVATGLSDWSDTYGGERRMGLTHGAANGVVAFLFGASLWARRRGRRGLGVALALAGTGGTLVSAYIGGHLSLALGIGVDQTAFEDEVSEWTAAGPEAEVTEEPRLVTVAGVRLVMARTEAGIHALAARCSHLGGPLHEGSVRDGCVVCPWHGSEFRLADGSIARGPARAPQPAYDVRVEDGVVHVRAHRA
jgi:nitrite reductase/ring-hydroxylating ferredoxin subunit/uncharacterized membrane protein